jgi:hypothetical protein
MNDNYYDSSSQDVADEDYYNGEGYENLGQPSFLTHKLLMFSAVGISLLVLVILVIWFFFPRDKLMNSEELKMLESRVGELENKLRRFDKIGDLTKLTNTSFAWKTRRKNLHTQLIDLISLKRLQH